MVNGLHNVLKHGIDLFKAPAEACTVLAHLQAADRYTARVGSFAGGIEHAGFLINADGFGSIGHICAFTNNPCSVFDDCPRGFFVNFVLCGTGKNHIRLNIEPHIARAFHKFCRRNGFEIFFNASVVKIDFFHHFGVNAVFVGNISAAVTHSDDLCTKFDRFFAGIDSDIARA